MINSNKIRYVFTIDTVTIGKSTVEVLAGNEPGAFKKLKAFKFKEINDPAAFSKLTLTDYKIVSSGPAPLTQYQKEQLEYQDLMDRMEDLLGSSSSSEDGGATGAETEERE